MTVRFVRSASALTVALVVTAFAGCAKQSPTAVAPAPTPPASGARVTPPPGPATQRTDKPDVSAQRQPDAAPQPAAGTAADSRPSPREFTPISDLRDVHFDFDKYDIRPQDADLLEADARWLRAHPNYLVLIEGHADERGTSEYNLTLGDRRAKVTMSYLVSQGVQERRITIVSYGEERPACAEKNDTCWSRNRRAHFLGKAG